MFTNRSPIKQPEGTRAQRFSGFLRSAFSPPFIVNEPRFSARFFYVITPRKIILNRCLKEMKPAFLCDLKRVRCKSLKFFVSYSVTRKSHHTFIDLLNKHNLIIEQSTL